MSASRSIEKLGQLNTLRRSKSRRLKFLDEVVNSVSRWSRRKKFLDRNFQQATSDRTVQPELPAPTGLEPDVFVGSFQRNTTAISAVKLCCALSMLVMSAIQIPTET